MSITFPCDSFKDTVDFYLGDKTLPAAEVAKAKVFFTETGLNTQVPILLDAIADFFYYH